MSTSESNSRATVPPERQIERDYERVELYAEVVEAVPGNRLRNESFDDDIETAPHWITRRTSGNEVHCRPEFALDGPNYMACSDKDDHGNGHPSISQIVGRLRDGKYKHVFTIYVRNDGRGPSGRKVQLALHQQINNDREWLAHKGEEEPVRDDWTKHSLVVDGGGGIWMAEAYWFDSEGPDICFDQAELRSYRR